MPWLGRALKNWKLDLLRLRRQKRIKSIMFRRGTGDAVHYAFLPRNEYKEPTKAENMFYNMGVNVIWYEDYKNLPGMIRRLTASAASRKICSVTEN